MWAMSCLDPVSVLVHLLNGAPKDDVIQGEAVPVAAAVDAHADAREIRQEENYEDRYATKKVVGTVGTNVAYDVSNLT